ncbi:MAG: hypothetical protein LBJ15_03510 [Comamonas sp.]|jgi:hypothetical protein|uniref:hypothetical protein n=1 Tax=Comamonas sp. TaxID=34028 RepID=UPI00282F8E80|nr:hypothetical protein [Comamonas sp.]MDR0213056.1 hypothetical protein [Comamonas sp.]
MKNIGLRCAMVMATVVIFVLMLVLNEWIFGSLSFVHGVNWIYLPAGVRLLCTLLFAGAGAVGLLIASWLVCFFYFFPDDIVRALYGSIVATLAPYLVYLAARRWMGLEKSLNNLTTSRLLVLSLLYAAGNALLHQAVSLLLRRGLYLDRVFVLMVGDVLGTLIVLYAAKLVLKLLPTRRSTYELKS